jgi:hypothetical protein
MPAGHYHIVGALPLIQTLTELRRAHANLLAPQKLWTREEVLRSPSVVPASPGVYAWYFKRGPANVPTEGCVAIDGKVLLYVGISPKAPPANGRLASRQNLRTRLRYHMRGDADGSTFAANTRLLLSDELGLELRRVGAVTGLRSATAKNDVQSGSLKNAFVTWKVTPEPWLLEHALISAVPLPTGCAAHGVDVAGVPRLTSFGPSPVRARQPSLMDS